MTITAETVLVLAALMPGFFGVIVYNYLAFESFAIASAAVFAVLLSVVGNYAAIALTGHTISFAGATLDRVFEAATLRYILVGSLVTGTIAVLAARLMHWAPWLDWLERRGLRPRYADFTVWEHFFRLNKGRWFTLVMEDGSRITCGVRWYSTGSQPPALVLTQATRHVRRSDDSWSETPMAGEILLTDLSGIRHIRAKPG